MRQTCWGTKRTPNFLWMSSRTCLVSHKPVRLWGGPFSSSRTSFWRCWRVKIGLRPCCLTVSLAASPFSSNRQRYLWTVYRGMCRRSAILSMLMPFFRFNAHNNLSFGLACVSCWYAFSNFASLTRGKKSSPNGRFQDKKITTIITTEEVYKSLQSKEISY